MKSRVLAALLVMTSVLVVIGSTVITAPAVGAAERPNIVIIVTDDQRWDALQSMPNVKALLRKQGVNYTNSFVPNSLCCPSRSSTLTGLHSHTTGVWGPPLRTAGSRASRTRPRSQPSCTSERAIGRCSWASTSTGIPKVTTPTSRRVGTGGSPLRAARTTTTTQRTTAEGALCTAARLPTIRGGCSRSGAQLPRLGSARPTVPLVFRALRSTRRDQPAYAVPDPRDVDALKSTLTPYRPPSYGTKDSVADMPAYIQTGTWSAGSVDTFRRRQLESLIGVDRSIGQLMSSCPPTRWSSSRQTTGTSGVSTSGIARGPVRGVDPRPVRRAVGRACPGGQHRSKAGAQYRHRPDGCCRRWHRPDDVPLGLDRNGSPVLAQGPGSVRRSGTRRVRNRAL